MSLTLEQLIRRHPRWVVLSGAGLSAASGIPTYGSTQTIFSKDVVEIEAVLTKNVVEIEAVLTQYIVETKAIAQTSKEILKLGLSSNHSSRK